MKLPIIFLFLTTSLMSCIFAQETRDVSFQAKYDQTEQKYMLTLPEGFDLKNSYDVLIALHGHGSDRRQYIENPRDETRGTREIAAKYKMIFVSPDYRAATSWMNAAAETDLIQIVELLKKEYHVKRIFLTGGSMGGTSALIFTALHPELIDGVASLNGTANMLEYKNFQDAISESYGGTKTKIPLEYKKRSAEYFPERFTMPVGVTTSGRDTVVPPDSVLRLVNIWKEIGKQDVLLIHRQDEGHVTNLEDTKAVLEYVITQAVNKPRNL